MSVVVDRATSHSRFDDWSRRSASVLLVLLGAVIIGGILLGGVKVPDTSHLPESKTDTALYEAIVIRVQHGENYYSAAATEQRERGYPLRPVMTMREPTLAYATAALGGVKHARYLLLVIAAGSGLAMLAKLERISRGRIMWWFASGLTALTAVVIFAPKFAVLHEVWASMFILLALLLRRPGRSALPSVLCGLIGVAIREIAFPFMAVMALLAWREGKIREFRQWLCASVVFLIGYAVHYGLVLSHTTAADLQSQGWLKPGGWPFALSTVRQTTVLSSLPFWVVAVIVPLSLLGWASIKSEFAIRVFFVLAAFLAIFTVIGRPENWYWGVLYVPLIGAGVAFSPSALWSLGKRALRDTAT